MMRRLATLGILLCNLTGAARADPYWMAWEGDDYPENRGWTREFGDENGYGQGGAIRSISDGLMTLDSMRHTLVFDSYWTRRSINPDVGEQLIVEWRVRVNEAVGPLPDVTVAIARDGRGIVSLGFFTDRIASRFDNWSVSMSAGDFHEFHLESSDMESYTLRMDGGLIATGIWSDSLRESYVAFGDSTYGGGVASRSEWDYFRFGAVPEPTSHFCLLVLACAAQAAQFSRRFR